MSSSLPPLRRRAARRAQPALPLYVFIAYAEVAAARGAIARVQQLLGRGAALAGLQPMLWRFNQLGQPRWRETALHEASRAHVIVLAMGNAPSLDASTDDWLTALTTRQAGAPITCLALMRDDEAWTISLQSTEPAAGARADLRPAPAVPHATRVPQVRAA